jgi:hypothetical protein
VRIERNHDEICKLSGDLVVIHVPVHLIDESHDSYEGYVTLRSIVGRFAPRETRWYVRNGYPAILSFGIPRRFFLSGEEVELMAVATDNPEGETTLWRQCYRASWLTTVPQLDTIPG